MCQKHFCYYQFNITSPRSPPVSSVSYVLETLLLLLVEHHISPLPSSILCEWCVRNIVVIISLTSHLPAPSNVKLPHSFQCHGGCVNCLQWNKSGQYLLSGSDDTNVCLWEPLSHKLITTIPSHHEQNVFSVKVGVNEYYGQL